MWWVCTAETPENGGHELLLRDDFLRNCMEMYSISSGRSEPSLRGFTLKHLNIIDPLKENNNLGRSVSRGIYLLSMCLLLLLCELVNGTYNFIAE